jgi:hypothetical protein
MRRTRCLRKPSNAGQDCDAALASEGSLRALTCVEERGDPCSAAVLPAPADQWISGLCRAPESHGDLAIPDYRYK